MLIETVRETPDNSRPPLSPDEFSGETKLSILKLLLKKHAPLKGEK